MKLIVGLGNPGLTYQKTRHNVGFLFIDQWAKNLGLKWSFNKSLKCEISEYFFKQERIIFIKPQTFMNASGEAVLAVKNYYHIENEDILVIYDDLDLTVGSIRIRKNGSNGGHKGMGNIIDLLKTNEIKRIRIGIDKSSFIPVVDYVLGRFNETQQAAINLILDKANLMYNSYLTEPFEQFMNRFNHHE